ncbi:unnamed protein product, partial [Musa textilis]
SNSGNTRCDSVKANLRGVSMGDLSKKFISGIYPGGAKPSQSRRTFHCSS